MRDRATLCREVPHDRVSAPFMALHSVRLHLMVAFLSHRQRYIGSLGTGQDPRPMLSLQLPYTHGTPAFSLEGALGSLYVSFPTHPLWSAKLAHFSPIVRQSWRYDSGGRDPDPPSLSPISLGHAHQQA